MQSHLAHFLPHSSISVIWSQEKRHFEANSATFIIAPFMKSFQSYENRLFVYDDRMNRQCVGCSIHFVSICTNSVGHNFSVAIACVCVALNLIFPNHDFFALRWWIKWNYGHESNALNRLTHKTMWKKWNLIIAFSDVAEPVECNQYRRYGISPDTWILFSSDRSIIGFRWNNEFQHRQFAMFGNCLTIKTNAHIMQSYQILR